MNPIAFHIGPIAVHWYGILIATAFLVAIIGSSYLAKRQGIDEDNFFNLLMITIVCAILGARLYYVVFNWEYYSANPAEIPAVWHGGLAVHGGILLGILSIFLCCRKWSMRFWQITDILAPFMILGQAIGRWGNFFNQEAYGYAVSRQDVPWAMYIDGQWRHPTFLYESLWDLAGFVILALMSRSRSKNIHEGDISLFYLIYYSCGRFVIEGFRTDSLMLGPLRAAQLVSLVIVVVSILIFFLRRPHAPRRCDLLSADASRKDKANE